MGVFLTTVIFIFVIIGIIVSLILILEYDNMIFGILVGLLTVLWVCGLVVTIGFFGQKCEPPYTWECVENDTTKTCVKTYDGELK